MLPRVGEAMHVDAPQEVLDQMPQPLRLDFYLDHARQGVTCRAEASYGARRLSVLTRDPDAVPDYARDAAGEARARQLVQQYFRLPAAGGTVATIGEKDTPAIARLLLDGMARLREAGTVHATEAFDRMLRREAPKVQVGLSVRSNLINLRVSADDLPLVSTVRLLAYITPPPVVMMPPEPLPVVEILVSEMITVVPSPSAPFLPPFPP